MKIRYNGFPGCFVDTEMRDRWEPGEIRNIDGAYAARLLGSGFFEVIPDNEKEMPAGDNKMAGMVKRK